MVRCTHGWIANLFSFVAALHENCTWTAILNSSAAALIRCSHWKPWSAIRATMIRNLRRRLFRNLPTPTAERDSSNADKGKVVAVSSERAVRQRSDNNDNSGNRSTRICYTDKCLLTRWPISQYLGATLHRLRSTRILLIDGRIWRKLLHGGLTPPPRTGLPFSIYLLKRSLPYE